jgi:uncharacterized protein
MHGLEEKDLQELLAVLSRFPEIDEAIIFGSRAKGNYKKGSDVDIALKGKNVGEILWRVSSYLNEESTMPYYFDILNYDTISNSDLKEHIDRVGISIYRR